MAECKAEKGSSEVGNTVIGMVIGGHAVRACDGCGKERACWYCAVDSAYLCECCDGNVHAANAVARRHERIRLGLTTSAVNLKRFPAPNLSPRKKPRSIRRHKPSSLIASNHGISSILGPNYIGNSSSNHNNSLICAPKHYIMINKPGNDFDFIANKNIDLNNKFSVKAEPYSPIGIDDQAKVPDHTDDDPVFVNLLGLRSDMQDNDLFFHQVPIYNPFQNQDHTPSPVDTKPFADNEEVKPTIIICPYSESREELALSTKSPSAHPQYELDYSSLSLGRDGVDSEEPDDQFADSSNGLYGLDQLDFDSMLHGNEEDGDDESSTHVHANSHGSKDACNGNIARDDRGSYAEGTCAHPGNGMDYTDIDNYEAHDGGYCDQVFGFGVKESESTHTWLYAVKVESTAPEQLMYGFNGADHQKLTATSQSGSDQCGVKLGLKLNVEDVLHAWSCERAGTSFWIDGYPPHQAVSNCLDFLGGWLVMSDQYMPSTCTSTSEGDGQQLVPVLDLKKGAASSAREASVLRYREKRRTRLFSKKIRYEVRKLNAEKRPRMKGRFVKRISILA